MIHVKKKKVTMILMAFGVTLVAASVILLVVSQVSMKNAEDNTKEIVSKIYSLMPEIKDGVPDERANVTMPMLEVEGINYVGIIEIPTYGVVLPIYGTWDAESISKYPCRYTGNVYEGSLIIGGSDNPGQFDFMKNITCGDQVYVTDVTGVRYSYVVKDIQITKDVSTEKLTIEEADFVFFARNTYGLDYTVVVCEFEW